MGFFEFGIGFVVGIIFFALVLSISNISEALNTLIQLCNSEWGEDNWNSYVEDGYWYCKPKENISPPPFDGFKRERFGKSLGE